MNKSQAIYFFRGFSKYLAKLNQRYHSWEHCYRFFLCERTSASPNYDMLSLHLAFYLASWGMYRGSSQLLQNDYLIHEGAIRDILWNPRYKTLWGKVWIDEKTDEKDIDLIFDTGGLIEQLEKYYTRKGVSPTDTLITKIILGTMGSVPAYDRFLKAGLGAYCINQKLGKPSFLAIIKEFGSASGFALPTYALPHSASYYPQMKIVDCIYWQLGFYIEEIEKTFERLKEPRMVVKNDNTGATGVITRSGNCYTIENSRPATIKEIVLAGWHK